ncbi:MAG: hypothetical protein B7X84_04120, partial [Alphaproteobacteria bacterium 17-39-52]
GTASPQNILFEPFFEMLKASPVQDHLKDLLKREDPSSRSSFARESHTVSLAGNTAELPQSTYGRWETVSLEENPNALNFLAQQKPRVRTVFLGKPPSSQNLFATRTEEDPESDFVLGTKTLDSQQQKYFYSERQTLSPETVLYQEEVSFDPKQELESFIKAFTIKNRMNLQFKKAMKKRAKEKYEAFHAEKPRSIPSDKVTATEAHLRLWLGETYLPGDHKANIKALIANVGLKEELRREAELTEEALDYLSRILDTNHRLTTHERLQEMPFGYDTFYHGCRQEMITLYQAYSALENLFSLQDKGEFSALRGTFSYMDKYTEMTKALETFHQDHRAFYVSLYNQYKSENRDPKLIESSAEYQTWMEAQKEKVQDVMKRTIPLSDFKKDNGYLMLWLNAILTAGQATTTVTSSTIEYFLNSHSVKEPCDAKLFLEFMALRGIEASYQWFQSLNEQYISPLAPAGKSNGGLLQVFVNTAWEDLYTITLRDGASGTPYGHPVDVPEADRKPYVSRLLEKLHKEAQKQDLPVEEQIAQDVMEDMIRQIEGSLPRDEKTSMKSLVSEMCLFMHPLLTQAAFKKQTPEADPDTVEAMRSYESRYHNPHFPPFHTRGYFRYPLSEEKSRDFDDKLSELASALLADWLRQGTKPLEGSFYAPPTFFDFYQRIYKDFTGESPPQETYKNSLPYLINMGDVETVKSFLNLHPNALTTLEIDHHLCLMKLCREEKWDMFLYLYESLKETHDLSVLFTPQNQIKFARWISDSKDFTEEALLFFEIHLDLSSFDTSLKEHLLQNILSNFSLSYNTYPENKESFSLKFFIDKGFRLPPVQDLRDLSGEQRIRRFQSLFNSYMPVEERDSRGYTPLEQLLDYIEPFQRGGPTPDLAPFILSLLQRGANWKSETRTPGIPILFELFKYIDGYKLKGASSELTGILQELSILRNETGLTCLQYLQKEYLAGHSYQNFRLAEDSLIPQNASRAHVSYPPYLKYFPLQTEWMQNPWASETSRSWQREFDAAFDAEDQVKISELLAGCTDLDLLKINEVFFTKPYNSYVALRSEYNKKMGQELTFKKLRHTTWLENFKSALENTIENNEETLRDLINTLESYVYSHEIDYSLTLFQEKFPDLYALYQEKQEKLAHDTHHLHPLSKENETLTAALQTQKKEEVNNALQTFIEKVRTILSDPSSFTRNPHFDWRSTYFPDLEEQKFKDVYEREFRQHIETLQTRKASFNQQKKEWEEAVQKAASVEDMIQLENLISTVPFEIAPLHETSNLADQISALFKNLLTNKFAALIPLLIEKIKSPAWWSMALSYHHEIEDDVLFSFFTHYSEPLVFLKSCPISPVRSLSPETQDKLTSFFYTTVPEFLANPISLIGEDTFQTFFISSLEARNFAFLDKLNPSVFRQRASYWGIPYFWIIAVFPEAYTFGANLLEKFPDLLTITEISGLTFEETLHHLKTYPDENASFTKQLEKFYVFLKPKV